MLCNWCADDRSFLTGQGSTAFASAKRAVHHVSQHVCVRWCHPLCRAPRFFRFHVVRMATCRILLCRYTDSLEVQPFLHPAVCLMGNTAVQSSAAQRACFFLKSKLNGCRRLINHSSCIGNSSMSQVAILQLPVHGATLTVLTQEHRLFVRQG